MAVTPATRVLVADDETTLHPALEVFLTSGGYEPQFCVDGAEALRLLQQRQFDLALLDIRMPHVDGIDVLKFIKENHPATEVIMITGVTDVRTAVDCMKMGAFHYLTKPFRAEELLEIVSRAAEHRNLRRVHTVMQKRLSAITNDYEIIGTSEPITRVLKTALRIAPSDSSVLIQGPSGTGKELVAHFIHKNSNRSGHPFVPINCASIPDQLFESELFGYEKGAFTDARTQKQGLVELADGGTLFLDEVAEIIPALQPKLLRFIQTGEFRRVGGTIALAANVRIVSASNKDLTRLVAGELFREDLFYRLNVITLTLPPLCERREDIPLLVDYFLNNRYAPAANAALRKSLTPDAMEILMEYPWPGNIRELENVIERAVILSTGRVIQAKDLSLPAARRAPVTSGDENPVDALISLDDIERLHIEAVLRRTRWNKNEAAKILGISLKTLYTKIAAYRLIQS